VNEGKSNNRGGQAVTESNKKGVLNPSGKGNLDGNQEVFFEEMARFRAAVQHP